VRRCGLFKVADGSLRQNQRVCPAALALSSARGRILDWWDHAWLGSPYRECFLLEALAAAPVEVQQRYEKSKDIVKISGPQGLRLIRGLNDEALSGNWKGFRPSRLDIQYRVIYKVQKDKVLVEVEHASAA
jgi:mRNA-degrading endonuclease YafQ of YafQ-DinJ toxin-antitoxin module